MKKTIKAKGFGILNKIGEPWTSKDTYLRTKYKTICLILKNYWEKQRGLVTETSTKLAGPARRSITLKSC